MQLDDRREVAAKIMKVKAKLSFNDKIQTSF